MPEASIQPLCAIYDFYFTLRLFHYEGNRKFQE
jgi:hypothetical protein